MEAKQKQHDAMLARCQRHPDMCRSPEALKRLKGAKDRMRQAYAKQSPEGIRMMVWQQKQFDDFRRDYEAQEAN
jgi:hypothetical protein